MSELIKYRPDIDGLRAFAIIPVVLYHAGFSIISGGFVGVDIFFVISGYLITRILAREIAEGRFSLIKFYDRRVRRIVPAYFFLAIVTAISAAWLLPPRMLAWYGGDLTSTAVFLSNFYFRSQTGYFEPASQENLLLHTWSLSVEEQFYIVWPLVLLSLMLPVFAKWRRPLLLLFSFTSLALASYAAVYRPESAFYYSPLRAWELLLGALVALRYFPLLSPRWAEGAATVGLTMIVLAALFFGSDSIVFPGLAALFPCGGAALVIWAGEAGKRTFVGTLLSSKPLVQIGLISYSLYLWHWPILALAKIYLNRDLTLLEGALLILVALSAAWVSWRFIEQRFKRNDPSTGPSETRTLVAGVLALLVLAGLGQLFVRTDGLPKRADPSVITAQEEVSRTWQARGARCEVDLAGMERLDDEGCRFGDNAPGMPVVVLWGDSHADHYAPAFDALGKKNGFTVLELSKQSCSPLLASDDSNFLESKGLIACDRFRRATLSRIVNDPTVRIVALGGKWLLSGKGLDQQEASLRQVVSRITASGKDVILLGPPPRFPNGGGRCLVLERFYRRGDEACYVRAEEQRALLAPITKSLSSVAGGSKYVYLLLPLEEFCDERWCRPMVDGHVGFRDDHHLNIYGAEHLVQPLSVIFHQIRVLRGDAL